MLGIAQGGLSASAATLGSLQKVFSTFLNNQQAQQGLFTSGLERARKDRFDARFEQNNESGLDPLRNTLSLFRNADNLDDAKRGLGGFTALRQPTASASLFDSQATGVPGLANTATGLVQQGLGGLNAAFGLEQQNLALRLSEIGNRRLDINDLRSRSLRGSGDINTALNLEGIFDSLVKANVSPEVAAQVTNNVAAQQESTTTLQDNFGNGTQFDTNGNTPIANSAFNSPEISANRAEIKAQRDVNTIQQQIDEAKANKTLTLLPKLNLKLEAALKRQEAARSTTQAVILELSES